MNTDEFTIETAPPPADRIGGRGLKSDLRKQVEALKVGQVLRWRGDRANKAAVDATVKNIRRTFVERSFTTRKENGGFDIYRTA